MNKNLILFDKNVNNERASFSGQHKGQVIVTIGGTDIVLWEEWNKVILPGSTFTAMKHFKDLVVPVKTPTYNAALSLDNTTSVTPDEERNDTFIYLFSLGTDGCGPEDSQKYDVNYTKWISPANLVPFKYPLSSSDLNPMDREKYFGRKTNTSANRIAYYFKNFDESPIYRQQYIDGTPIDENIYNSDNTLDVESFVQLKMSISNSDCREFFADTTGLADARVNTIQLLTAVPKTIEGYTYYQNIRPITKLNFYNEKLTDLNRGVDITYRIFY